MKYLYIVILSFCFTVVGCTVNKTTSSSRTTAIEDKKDEVNKEVKCAHCGYINDSSKETCYACGVPIKKD